MHTGPTIFVSQLVARIIAEQVSSNSGAALSTRFAENQPRTLRESRQRDSTNLGVVVGLPW